MAGSNADRPERRQVLLRLDPAVHEAVTRWAGDEFLVLLDYQNDGGADKLLQFLQKHPLMQHTTAVKNKRFVALRYEELTPGPANVAAIEKMARAVNR